MMVLAFSLHLPSPPPIVVASCRDCMVVVVLMMVNLSVLGCLCVQLLLIFRVLSRPCWVGALSMLMVSMLILIPMRPAP